MLIQSRGLHILKVALHGLSTTFLEKLEQHLVLALIVLAQIVQHLHAPHRRDTLLIEWHLL